LMALQFRKYNGSLEKVFACMLVAEASKRLNAKILISFILVKC